jgi:hypothetical protein
MSFDKNSKKDHAPNETAAPVRYTIHPGTESLIVLKTLPNSTCYLHQENDNSSNYILRLYADQGGVIRFHVRSDIEAEAVTRFLVKCELENKITTYVLELRSNSQTTNEMPFPNSKTPKVSQNEGRIRAALSNLEMLNLTDATLLERGYPPRPNHDTAPEAFETWKRLVSIPMTVVEPQMVTNHGVRAAGEQYHGTGRFWSGYVLRDEVRIGRNTFDARRYGIVQGQWRVPSVSDIGNSGNRTRSVIWVGLDGWWDNNWYENHFDLVQAGTGQDCTEVEIHLPPSSSRRLHFSFVYYYAWTEFLPLEKFMKINTSLSIEPGDEVFVSVAMLNTETGVIDKDGSGVFSITNITKGVSTTVIRDRVWRDANNLPIVDDKGNPWPKAICDCREAIWIVEAPLTYGFASDLANYKTVTINKAFACPIDTLPRHDFISFQEGAILQVTMVNDRNRLSTVEPIDSQSMRFTWHAFY